MDDKCEHNYRAFNELGEVVSMACDRWACPACARANAYRWAERIRFGISLWPLQDCYFWTLTLPGWVHNARTGFQVLPGYWDKFRREIQQTYHPWHYAAFVECHPHRAYIPHFHIISLQPSPRRLKDIAAHAGFGYQASDFQLAGKVAAWYVSKYASKQGYRMDRDFHRVRVSRSWPKLPKPAYDKRVYPMKNRESVKSYLRRVAGLTGMKYDVLLSSWLIAGRGTDGQ